MELGNVGTIGKSVFGNFLSLESLVFIAFMAIGIIMILIFTDNGPKKWISILGILFGGGILVWWTEKKRKYTKKMLDQHNKQILQLRNDVKNRNEMITKNQKEVERLRTERENLLQDREKHQNKINNIEIEIKDKIEESKKLKEALTGLDSEIKKDLDEIALEKPMLTPIEILEKYNMGNILKEKANNSLSENHGATTATASSEEIQVNGFVMKGDV